MRQIVVFWLKSAGYDVLEAGDGDDALVKLKTKKVDLAIVDINLPTIDGIALITLMLAQPDDKQTPILVLTVESSSERKAQGQAAGANACLVKPFEFDQLLKVVKRFLPSHAS
jgi:two-component system chemotaxis response regulator CheY